MRGEVTVVRPLADFLDRVGRGRLCDLELRDEAEQAPRGANGVEEHCQQRQQEEERPEQWMLPVAGDAIARVDEQDEQGVGNES